MISAGLVGAQQFQKQTTDSAAKYIDLAAELQAQKHRSLGGIW